MKLKALLFENLPKVFICIIFVFSIFNLKSLLEKKIAVHEVDEIHTIKYALDYMNGEKLEVVRVGETTRWLARIISPLAVYYMNSRMGGEHVLTGWDYSGYSYLKKKNPGTGVIGNDPNIQDFIFAMRFILGVLVILSFAASSYLISSTLGPFVGNFYFLFSMGSTIVFENFGIFYTESSLLILLNLVLILGFAVRVNIQRLFVWASFILACAISTKLTGLVLVIPILVLIYEKDKKVFKGLKIELFALLSLVFLMLINFPAVTYMDLIDQTLSNVYHLKTGHVVTQASPLYQLKRSFEKLFPWSLLILVSIIPLLKRCYPRKRFILSILLMTVVMILPLIGVSYFHLRNLVTPLVLCILLSSIFIGLNLNKIEKKVHLSNKRIRELGYISVLGILIILSMYRYYNVTEVEVAKSVSSCTKVALIDYYNDMIPSSSKISGMPLRYTFNDVLPKLKKSVEDFDCVIVKNINNNKHFSHYILPQNYNLTNRFKDIFVFKK